MKPFLALSETTEYYPKQLDQSIPENRSGIYYNGWFLQIDPSIYPYNNLVLLNVFYTAMYRITSFLNTVSLSYHDQVRILRVTGYSNPANFKIEPITKLYMGGYQYQFVYKEKDSRPSIITK